MLYEKYFIGDIDKSAASRYNLLDDGINGGAPMRIGLQISSLKKYIQTRDDTAETFRRVRELGYQDVQLQWTGPDVDSDFLAELLRAHGMRCWGARTTTTWSWRGWTTRLPPPVNTMRATSA